MLKRGQTGVIIVTSIVIVSVVMITYIIYSNIQSKSMGTTGAFVSREPIYDFVVQCMDEKAIEGLRLLGVSGGCIESFDNCDSLGFFEDVNVKIPYYYVCDEVNADLNCVRGREKLVSENLGLMISKYLNDNINDCLRSFNDFKKEGYNLAYNDYKFETEVFEGRVDIKTADFKIDVKKGDYHAVLSDFKTSIEIRIPLIQDTIADIIDQIKKDSSNIDLTYMSLSDLEINRIDTTNNNARVAVYFLTDYDNVFDNEPYRFWFALKYRPEI